MHSCALAIHYNEDWTEPACDPSKATLKAVDDHVSTIFEKCQDGGTGKVGGHAKFEIPGCPARIQIISTAGKKPPQGEAP